MANRRTVFPIPADTWVRVINGLTAGTIYRKNNAPTYVSVVFDDVGDAPVDGTIPETAQAIFEDGNNEPISFTTAAYIWVACAKSGQSGSVIITL